MEVRKNVKHSFDLSGMEPGDNFHGCMRCNIQYEKNVGVKAECSNCMGRMGIYYVTKGDVTPSTNPEGGE